MYQNEWTVAGEVFYLKELEGEFSASVKARGMFQRENESSAKLLEMSCLMQKEVYEDAKRRGLKLYSFARFSGHFETWTRIRGGRQEQKNMLIADYVMDIENKK